MSSTGIATVILSCSFYRENFAVIESTTYVAVSTIKHWWNVDLTGTDSAAVLGSDPDAFRQWKTTLSYAATDYALSMGINTFPPTPSFALDIDVVGGTGSQYSYWLPTNYYPVDTFARALTIVARRDQK